MSNKSVASPRCRRCCRSTRYVIRGGRKSGVPPRQRTQPRRSAYDVECPVWCVCAQGVRVCSVWWCGVCACVCVCGRIDKKCWAGNCYMQNRRRGQGHMYVWWCLSKPSPDWGGGGGVLPVGPGGGEVPCPAVRPRGGRVGVVKVVVRGSGVVPNV